MSTISMEAPLGYALDALAQTRGNPQVRALPFGNTIYTLFWRREGFTGWPNTIADYNAMDHPQYIKDAVKRMLLAFREITGTAFVTFELRDTPEEFFATTALSATRPNHSLYVEVEAPPHYTSQAEALAVLAETRPDLIVSSLDDRGRATITLHPDHYSAIQRRFAAEAGFDGVSRTPVATTDMVTWLFSVGPRGGLTDLSIGRDQPVYRLNVPTRASIEQKLQDARAVYRERVLRRIRTGANDSNADFEAKRIEHRAKSAANFTAFRNRANKSNEMVIPTLPFVPNGVKASRRWGIEIETGAGRDIKVSPTGGWQSKGDGSLDSAYSGSYVIDPQACPENAYYHGLDYDDDEYMDPDYCDSCGDMYGSYESGDCVEWVSPILTSMHSRGLKVLTDQLEFAPRTDSAGIHVHVEAKDLTVGQIRELILSYDHLEPLIESSYDRVERGYCKRRSTSELLEIVRDAENKKDRPATEVRTGDRYVTVNLLALDYHGTVEFRAMGPRYNYDHLVRWAMFCREMVNCARNGATSKLFAKVRVWDDVLAIFAKYGSEYNKAAGFEAAEVTEEAELQAV